MFLSFMIIFCVLTNRYKFSETPLWPLLICSGYAVPAALGDPLTEWYNNVATK